MKDVKRRVMNEEHGRTFDELIGVTRVTGRYLCSLLERFRRDDDRDENEMSSAKMDENRGRFLGVCLVPKHSDQVLEVRVPQDEDAGSVALCNWERGETQITKRCRVMCDDDADREVNAMLTQISRSKEHFVSMKFQWLVTALCKEQGGIVRINTRKKFDFVQNPGCTFEKLREWYCNIDSLRMSVHCTGFEVKDLRKERVRWQVWQGVAGTCTGRSTRQDHAAEPSVPARNESEWSGGRHSYPREATQVGWQKWGVIKPMFRNEGLCENHRSAVVGQHVESRDQDGGHEGQRVEGLKVQGEECVRSRKWEFRRNSECWYSRRRVECLEDRVSTDDRRKFFF